MKRSPGRNGKARGAPAEDQQPSSPDPRPRRSSVLLSLVCFILWAVGAGLTPALGLWGGIGLFAIGLGILVLLKEHDTLLPLLKPSLPLALLGLAAGLVMLGVTYGVYPPASRFSAAFLAGTQRLYVILTSFEPRWLTLLALPLIIIAEELIWRGTVFAALRSRVSPTAAVLFSAAAYAIGHAPVGSPLLVLLALICGLYWSALRALTRSLIPGLLSHLIWDLFVFLLRPLA